MILIPGYGGPLKGVLRVNLNNVFSEMIKEGVLMPTCEFILSKAPETAKNCFSLGDLALRRLLCAACVKSAVKSVVL